MRDELHTTTSRRETLARMSAVLAVALTAFGIYVGFDMATTTYVGVYVGLTRSFATVLAVLIAAAWTGVALLYRSARRDR